MATTGNHTWHWPVALALALLLHGLAVWWLLTTTKVQPVAEVTGSSGVVISLANAEPAAGGAQPANNSVPETATELPATQAPPEIPVPEASSVAADQPPEATEVITKPPVVEDVVLPVAIPEVPSAVTPDAPPTVLPAEVVKKPAEPPIAKTYAIPAEELKAMQLAERRRQQAREREQRQQEQLREQQRRRNAEIKRQQAAARQKAAEENRQRLSATQQQKRAVTTPAAEGLKTASPAEAESGQASPVGESGSAATPTGSEANISAAAGATQGSDEIPDCRDDSDIGGDGSKAQYKNTLRRYLLARQQYPRRAAQRRQQGCVVAQISIDTQGRVTAASVIRKSGYRLLDSAALKLVKPGKKLPTPPAALANLNFKIPFDYRLN